MGTFIVIAGEDGVIQGSISRYTRRGEKIREGYWRVMIDGKQDVIVPTDDLPDEWIVKLNNVVRFGSQDP